MAWWSKAKGDAKERLLAEIRAEFADCAGYLGRARPDERVIEALAAVPRERFVNPADEAAAYDNRPLAIGHGQTISQPFIVAAMTDLLAPEPDHRVLEIGTGSGYQAAVLARLAKEVYTIETVAELAETARERLARLGYDNVFVRHGDGGAGWPEAAPFDGVIVTAAAAETPARLVEQLKAGGRMVIPLEAGPGGFFPSHQVLAVLTKGADGGVERRDTLPVAFVPFVTGAQG